ncbi:hypothetical protein ACH5RR_014490 [Cinchona calisaya]|uniref:Uncharacterized protein n=1 Tax=Cinchona calisaya TaxID=153742 RepID=A0ABD3A4I7_9GENT
MASIMKIIIWLSLLTQVHYLAAKPLRSRYTGITGLWNQQKRIGDQPVTAASWWSEDYSLPRRRRPVHNDLKS